MFVLCVKNRDVLRFNFPEISSLFRELGMILAIENKLIDRTNYIRAFTKLILRFLKKNKKLQKHFKHFEVLEIYLSNYHK
jgi:tRNA G10  N-methylase Trm11